VDSGITKRYSRQKKTLSFGGVIMLIPVFDKFVERLLMDLEKSTFSGVSV